MGREQFLQQAEAAALALSPITVHGVTFWARPTSMRDVRLSLERLASDRKATIVENLASRMLDADGKVMFDASQPEDLQALQDALDKLPGDFLSKCTQDLAKLDPPIKEEVDAEGN